MLGLWVFFPFFFFFSIKIFMTNVQMFGQGGPLYANETCLQLGFLKGKQRAKWKC